MAIQSTTPVSRPQVNWSPETATSPQGALLSMQNITKDFPAGRVLHGVNLELGRGEVRALVGQNGAGKSTLMKILAGLYPDHGGDVMVGGNVVHMRSPRKALEQRIAVIHQEFALAPDLTGAENIALGREPGKFFGHVDHAALLRRSRAEAQSVGIDIPLDVPVGKLSVGQQQLTEIVKALARDAQILVMDEPTARLSATERDQLFAIIKKLSARGVAIVYISHFLEEIFAVATTVTVLRDGHHIASGPLSGMTIAKLARLIVGDKYTEFDLSQRQQLDIARERRRVLLDVQNLAIEGKFKPSSFSIHQGEVVGLAGLQGAGRTELADALVGNSGHRCTGGISIDGFTGLFKSPKQALAKGVLMLPASRKTQGILPSRSLAENVAVSALNSHLSSYGMVKGHQRRKLVKTMLQRFAVRPKDPSRVIATLSGGNQQKVLFARASAAGAKLLVLDQPTAGVDVGATVEIYDQVDAMTQAGMGIVVISDDLNELLRLCDRILLVKDGAIIDDRPISQYTRASLLAAITTGTKPENHDAADDSGIA